MDAIRTLEDKLKRIKGYKKGYKRPKFLGNIYKQLATSHKGRKSDGEFRNFVESNQETARLFIWYFANKLDQYGLNTHAQRLRSQYSLPIDMEVLGLEKEKVDSHIHGIISAKDGSIYAWDTDAKIPFSRKVSEEDVLYVAMNLGRFIFKKYAVSRLEIQDVSEISSGHPSFFVQEIPRVFPSSCFVVHGGGLLNPDYIDIRCRWDPLVRRPSYPKETLVQYAESLKN